MKKPIGIFSRPDFTVGTGITPVLPPTRLADYTAGRESHPALKTLLLYTRFFSLTIGVFKFILNIEQKVKLFIFQFSVFNIH